MQNTGNSQEFPTTPKTAVNQVQPGTIALVVPNVSCPQGQEITAVVLGTVVGTCKQQPFCVRVPKQINETIGEHT